MINKDNAIRLIPLGGFGQIGMNSLLLEASGKLMMIDCGVMFPSAPKYGIDIIHPSFDYLRTRRDDLVGVVLTHGHEDHIAGIPFLLKEMYVPVYGTDYTLGLVRERMSEFEHSQSLDAKYFKLGDHLEMGPFKVTSFQMPHSIIQNAGFVIEVSGLKILHTGDFKLRMKDKSKGEETLERLKNLAGDNVDLMISDSTGAEENQNAGEESTVLKTLTELARDTSGMMVVATFSSNIQRIESLVQVAQKTGRYMFISGRSVETHVSIATSVNALKLPQSVMISEKQLSSLPRNRILAVISGTQGEKRSSLGRLASDTHKNLSVETGDTVVLSSRFIPGNELAIAQTIDSLLRLGARVVHNKNHEGVHVSGHGSKKEIRAAINAVKPKALLPAHGTYRHMSATAEIARSLGIPSVEIASNGDIVCLSKSGLSLDGEVVPSGKVNIDGGSSVSSTIMHDRSILGARGVLYVGWITEDQGRAKVEPEVFSRGVVSEEMHGWFADQVREEINRLNERISDNVRLDNDAAKEYIRKHLRRFAKKIINREPYVIITILSHKGTRLYDMRKL